MTAADVDDGRAAGVVFARLEDQPLNRVGRVFAEFNYHNHALYKWVSGNAPWELVLVRPPNGSERWVELPIRWSVERTFAWLAGAVPPPDQRPSTERPVL